MDTPPYHLSIRNPIRLSLDAQTACLKPLCLKPLYRWLPETVVVNVAADALRRRAVDFIEEYILRGHEHLLETFGQNPKVRICAYD